MIETGLFDSQIEEKKKSSGPVTCLGMTFENDEARRAHFTEELRKKLQDPEFRKIEGFPIGSDEDILGLSDPPYYTACPNPWIEDFAKYYRKNSQNIYSKLPFVADISEGKKHPLYSSHSYHTKVPHRAIMRYLDHYTENGDIVLDPFSGSGMTGLAALLYDGKSQECNAIDIKKSHDLEVALSDLSPAATFISSQYLKIFPSDLLTVAKNLIKKIENEWAWLYQSISPEAQKVKAYYYVWSDIFICPNCSGEFDFYSVAVDPNECKIYSEFVCPHCESTLGKRKLEKSYMTIFDPYLNEVIKWPKSKLVLVSNEGGKDAREYAPSDDDLLLIKKIDDYKIPFWVPTQLFPKQDRYRRDALKSKGVSHAHHFYTKRNLIALSVLYNEINCLDLPYRHVLLHAFTGILLGVSRLQRYRPGSGFPNMVMSGTLYIGSLVREWNVFNWFIGKVKSLESVNKYKYCLRKEKSIITTQSSSSLLGLENSIDYIFVDPPFGGNLQYSELNFMYESWLRVFTSWESDTVVNEHQGKNVMHYAQSMKECFKVAYHALKPGRWMTIEFHNSAASIWNSIQETLSAAGFIIADVRVIDKQQNTFKQINNPGSVKQDLAITAYKPDNNLSQRFELEAGTEDGVWDFTRSHLKQLPVFVQKDSKAEIIIERQNYLLFDRMVAFHIQRRVAVPISSNDFYLGLAQRFAERDGMFFLSEQVAEYDKKRMTVSEVLQLQLFVSDESSAILWLKQQLMKKPQTFQELHPQFLKEIGGWSKNEKPLELSTLLEQNFLKFDGRSEIPSQIHSYLSTNWPELRNRIKEDAALIKKALERWFVPDPKKAGDLEKLREKSLLRDFEEYKNATKKLKVFRIEAVRAGFKKAWQERDYTVIIDVANKIPNNILEEDSKLLMWFDQAVTRMGGE